MLEGTFPYVVSLSGAAIYGWIIYVMMKQRYGINMVVRSNKRELLGATLLFHIVLFYWNRFGVEWHLAQAMLVHASSLLAAVASCLLLRRRFRRQGVLNPRPSKHRDPESFRELPSLAELLRSQPRHLRQRRECV